MPYNREGKKIRIAGLVKGASLDVVLDDSRFTGIDGVIEGRDIPLKIKHNPKSVTLPMDTPLSGLQWTGISGVARRRIYRIFGEEYSIGDVKRLFDAAVQEGKPILMPDFGPSSYKTLRAACHEVGLDLPDVGVYGYKNI